MSPSSEVPEALQRADLVLRRNGTHAQDVAWGMLSDEANAGRVAALKKESGLEGDDMERLLLWHAARRALPNLSSLPIDNWVRGRLEQDLRQLHMMTVPMEAGSYHFDRAAKIATLRRFPAGPMEWEISGVPRSYFLQATFPDSLRFLAFVVFRLGGRAPCFFMHVAPAPRKRALSVPKEVLRSYYRMARSLELQPDMRALLADAWFHDPAAVRDHPQLEVLSRPYVNHGGMITLLRPAPPSSGVLDGNPERSADYQAGRVRYRCGFAIWPRDAAIRWAHAHPELGD
ncbi:MAG: hypothetical protein ACLQVN_03125 [Bryobacteraceae bacterium]